MIVVVFERAFMKAKSYMDDFEKETITVWKFHIQVNISSPNCLQSFILVILISVDLGNP